jgi:hypothetical protein
VLFNKKNSGSPFYLHPDVLRSPNYFDPKDIFLRLGSAQRVSYTPPNNILATDSYSDDFEPPDHSYNSVDAAQGDPENDMEMRTKQVTV